MAFSIFKEYSGVQLLTTSKHTVILNPSVIFFNFTKFEKETQHPIVLSMQTEKVGYVSHQKQTISTDTFQNGNTNSKDMVSYQKEKPTIKTPEQ